jgi:phosphoribosylanthranilate isomerase
MLIKICGITTEADALLAVALGADAIGFIFAPSSRQVSAQATRRIIERVPPEILTVGVFRNEAPARLVETVNSIGLRAAQLHGDETVEQTNWVAERVPLTIKAFPAGHPGIGRIDEYGAQLVLVDADSPGSGEVFDWRLAEGVVDPARLIVSGGLRPENVGDAIAHLHPYGVDVSSGVETAPGRKDPVKLRAFVAAARAAAGEAVAAVDGESGGAAEGDDAELTDGGVERPFDWREEGG